MSRGFHYIYFFISLCVWEATLAPAPVWAGDILIQWNNDKVADTDRHYTNGTRIAYTPTKPDDLGYQFQSANRFLATAVGMDANLNFRNGWVFGQDMYTPEDVYAIHPNPNDRPYAGWTYFGLTSQTQSLRSPDQSDQPHQFLEKFDRQDTFELDLGIIGPASKAAQTQTAFHRLINVGVSRGWRDQIHNEPGILGTRTIKFRSPTRHGFGTNWPETDVITHTTAQLGNIRTALGGGITIRLGGNLKEDFGPVYGPFAVPPQKPKAITWSVFTGFEARGIARDVFLDGNTFQTSPHVKRTPLVLETRLGFATHIPIPPSSPMGREWGISGIRIGIDMVQRSREFVTQDKADRYGSLKLTMNF